MQRIRSIVRIYLMNSFFFFFFFLAPAVTQAVITVGNVPVQQGQSIIIPCLYKEKYISLPKYLCFGSLWSFCTDVKQMKHRSVSISDDQTQFLFTVTMRNVTPSDAGRYWCSVDTPGFDVKKSFQLKVTKGEIYSMHHPFVFLK